jgi:hypothetical protein
MAAAILVGDRGRRRRLDQRLSAPLPGQDRTWPNINDLAMNDIGVRWLDPPRGRGHRIPGKL